MDKSGIVRTVLGEAKPLARHYEEPDGSVYYGSDCPFCFYPISPEHDSCRSPFCVTQFRNAQKLMDFYHQQAALEYEEYQRKRNYELSMERIRLDKEAEEKAYREAVAEAKRRGSCVQCCWASYRRAKFIKHRAGHPHLEAQS